MIFKLGEKVSYDAFCSFAMSSEAVILGSGLGRTVVKIENGEVWKIEKEYMDKTTMSTLESKNFTLTKENSLIGSQSFTELEIWEDTVKNGDDDYFWTVDSYFFIGDSKVPILVMKEATLSNEGMGDAEIFSIDRTWSRTEGCAETVREIAQFHNVCEDYVEKLLKVANVYGIHDLHCENLAVSEDKTHPLKILDWGL